MTYDETQFYAHLKKHTNPYVCAHCGTGFKKRKTVVAHLKKHESINPNDEFEVHICEVCGKSLPNEVALKEHCEKRHEKNFICFYCGRAYKGELNLEIHLRKHETCNDAL